MIFKGLKVGRFEEDWGQGTLGRAEIPRSGRAQRPEREGKPRQRAVPGDREECCSGRKRAILIKCLHIVGDLQRGSCNTHY